MINSDNELNKYFLFKLLNKYINIYLLLLLKLFINYYFYYYYTT